MYNPLYTTGAFIMSVTEDIKARLDIVNFISQYVSLKKAGRNYTAPCPFHSERTPSFVVFPESQSWRCFGSCGEGGDIFNFVMKREGLDFAGALQFLAAKAGVELHQRTQEQISRDEQLDKLRGLLEETTRFFHERLLKASDADHARAYVRKRGLTEATIDAFMIGYAPKDWRQTLDHLLVLGYTENEVVEVGVAIRNENGRVYDRFRNRLTIPIYDGRGRVIGFGARALDPNDNPKYLNSPQTVLFDKGATLFGLHLARPTIRETETAVIVEGYMDAIQAHQAGFNNVVAQMGTALTAPQLKQLSKYARTLILALDPDAAGAKATMRGLNVIREKSGSTETFFDPSAMMKESSKLDVELRVMTLPDGQDPDDLIRENPEGWRTRVANAQPVADYVIEVGTAHLTAYSSLSDREKAARDILPILLATENDLQRHVNVQQLALKLRLDERMLIEWAQRRQASIQGLQAQRSPQAAKPSQTPASVPKATGDALERFCLAALLKYPGWLSFIDGRLHEVADKFKHGDDVLGPLSAQDFTQPDYRAIFDALEQALSQYAEEPIEYLEDHLPYELKREIEALSSYPWKNFEQRLTTVMALDTAKILRERQQNRIGTQSSEDDDMLIAVLRRAFELRKLRLRRENIELQYLQQELLQPDPTLEPQAYQEQEEDYLRRVWVKRRAISFIESAVWELAQRRRES